MDIIDIGNRRELFVDRYLIDRLGDGAALRLGEPRPAGPALRFDQPWEGPASGYVTVLRDAARYLLYYRGWPDSNDDDIQTTCVAESSDGCVFQRPNVGLFDVCGTRHNNVVLTVEEDMYTHNFAPFLDGRGGVPEDQRFKALTRNYGLPYRDKRKDIMGLFAFVSADGYHWRKLNNDPVITKGLFDSQNVSFWSEHEGCYVCYLREAAGDGDYVHGDGVRSIARCCSDDFLNWSAPKLVDMGDTPPEHLYTNQTQPYFRAPHIYIALPGRFMPGRQVLSDEEGEALSVVQHNGRGYWHDCSDAVLLTSRGGNRYDRTFMEAFVRPGRDRRNWTSRCNYPACGIVQTAPDEMSIYVERHNAQAGKYLERLTLRLDGFASLSAGYSGGVMITKPLMFSGERLKLNYATSAAGHIRVELQDQTGKAVVGHTLQDCSFIVGDEIEHTVTWNGNADISHLSERPVRFRFELKDADIYSFQVQNTNTAEPSVPGDA